MEEVEQLDGGRAGVLEVVKEQGEGLLIRQGAEERRDRLEGPAPFDVGRGPLGPLQRRVHGPHAAVSGAGVRPAYRTGQVHHYRVGPAAGRRQLHLYVEPGDGHSRGVTDDASVPLRFAA